jgi:hypothetical protein
MDDGLSELSDLADLSQLAGWLACGWLAHDWLIHDNALHLQGMSPIWVCSILVSLSKNVTPAR